MSAEGRGQNYPRLRTTILKCYSSANSEDRVFTHTHTREFEVPPVGGGDQKDLITNWPLTWIQALEGCLPPPCTWNVGSIAFHTLRGCSKDKALK